jgi:isopentenyl diphosphate isomerase/L-lactate dehydrogenase-like FMN-dependent dehydrogenase
VAAAIPAGILCAADYEQAAQGLLDPALYAYIAGGSAHDQTLADNRRAFDGWALLPRLLNDVRDGHTRVALPGGEWPHPLMLAPVAYQQLVHPQAELDTARAAAATDTTMVCSTLSSRPVEAVVGAAGRVWFQLYFQPDRTDTLALLRRAEAAGCQALVVTLDAAIQAPSLRALRAGFRMPADCVAVHLADLRAAQVPAQAPQGAGPSRIFQGAMGSAPTWSDLDWLMQQTRLPVWVKGVLHPADAVALRARGVAGLIVSNHGGRGLDGACASLDALPAIRQAVGHDTPLLLDSGIRSGQDTFKALALGANAVLIGRLQLYALRVAGALGVAHMLQLLREELEICMAMTGCAHTADIGPHVLTRRHPAPHTGA